MTAEDYIKEYGKSNDLEPHEGNLNDALWTNNVLEYMKEFAQLHVQKALEAAHQRTDGVMFESRQKHLNAILSAYPFELIK